MKIIFPAFILLAAFSYTFSQEIKPNLEVETSVIGQKACLTEGNYTLGSGETIEYRKVRIDLELQNAVTNRSDLPVILDKRGGTIRGYSIFEMKLDSTRGRQLQATGWGLSVADKYTTEIDVPSQWFMILNKNETLNLKQDRVRMFFDHPGKYNKYSDREYFMNFFFLSVSGQVFDEDEKDLHKLRRKWSKIGYFWFEDFETKSVLIHFPNHESLKICAD